MIYNLSFFSDIGFSIKQALRTFSCKIATILYDWIIDLYNVFNDKLEYLPNPNSIYPTELGYREIFNIVKNSIN